VVMTAQSIGAALSTALAGLVVVHAGYSAAFITLGGMAAIGVVVFFFAMPETQPPGPGVSQAGTGGIIDRAFRVRSMSTGGP
jgi:predicted MFS family arabinose efflux permease